MSRVSGKFNMKNFLYGIVLLFMVGLFFFFLFKGNDLSPISQKDVDENVESISQYNFSSVEEVKRELDALESSGEIGDGGQTQYKKLFEGSIVVGDSITEGLSVYDYLENGQVLSEIGASVMHSDGIFAQAAAACPERVYFSFGMNDMGNYSGDADMFIDRYTERIKAFMTACPNAKVYVNSISRPSDEFIQEHKIYSNYIGFNAKIKGMCDKLKITYIDNVPLLESHPELYASDGVHVDVSYYPLWINNMLSGAVNED